METQRVFNPLAEILTMHTGRGSNLQNVQREEKSNFPHQSKSVVEDRSLQDTRIGGQRGAKY